jgi:acetyl esterase/lipase
VILYFHGGGYLAGSGKTHGAMLAHLSEYSGVPVFAQDYRLLQTAPFPAPPDDAVAAWDDLIERGWRPCQIVLGGDSAGGGLMLALLATLCARGTPPAGAFALSPWTDLTLSGKSIAQNAGADPALPAHRLAEAAAAYLNGAEATDPRASPLFALFANPPPVLFQVGSPEILEDDTYRMANRLRAAGGQVEVETWQGAAHVWHLGAAWVPEARAALRNVARFVQACLDSTSR